MIKIVRVRKRRNFDNPVKLKEAVNLIVGFYDIPIRKASVMSIEEFSKAYAVVDLRIKKETRKLINEIEQCLKQQNRVCFDQAYRKFSIRRIINRLRNGF